MDSYVEKSDAKITTAIELLSMYNLPRQSINPSATIVSTEIRSADFVEATLLAP